MKEIQIRQNTIWKTILNSIQYFLYIVGVYLVIQIAVKIGTVIGSDHWPPTSEQITSWSQVLIAYAAFFAIGQYSISYIDIADKKTKNVLEYVKFFREAVISSGNKIRQEIKKKKREPLPTFLIRKNTPFLNFTSDEFFEKIDAHQKILITKYINMIASDLDLDELVLDCLNASEEFAIGIINSNSQNHPAVVSIKRPYIQIIEEFAVPLYFRIGVMNDGFPYVSKLYRHWKKEVGFIAYDKGDRLEDYNERLKKHNRSKIKKIS